MRVMIAYDGSAGAIEAVGLADAIRWPARSSIRVVSVVEPAVLQLPPWPAGDGAAIALDEDVLKQVAADQADVVARLSTPDRDVDAVILRDRPASGLMDHAREFSADLLITGPRGHSPIASLLLGSVSAEIVDHAPCPVIVARGPTLERIVFATDGSETAATAEGILADWPIFAAIPIRVVSVADVVRPWTTGVAPTMYAEALSAYAEDLADAASKHQQIANGSAARLSEAGRQADAEVRRGDAAAEIIAAALEARADLIAIGSRGHTGVQRILLGSVARNVMSGSDASVLVVRAQASG